MKHVLHFSFLLASCLLLSCGDSGKPASTETGTAAEAPPAPAPRNPESDLGKAATEKLMDVLVSYYSLKDALVATDGAKADEAASKLMSSAELFHGDMPDVAPPTQRELLPQLELVMARTEAMMSPKAEDIEEKRVLFSEVSEAVYKVAQIAKLRNAGVYHQYCPMAFDDKGAYWLSPDPEIRNPYYGKKMLACGEVRDSM